MAQPLEVILDNSEFPHKIRPTDAAAARSEPARSRRAEWLVGEDKPDLKVLLTVREVRLIIEPAAAAVRASHDQATQTAADKEFHIASWMPRTTPVLQGIRGAIDTILNAVLGSPFRMTGRHA